MVLIEDILSNHVIDRIVYGWVAYNEFELMVIGTHPNQNTLRFRGPDFETCVLRFEAHFIAHGMVRWAQPKPINRPLTQNPNRLTTGEEFPNFLRNLGIK